MNRPAGISEASDVSLRQTAFSDVCGTVDELERRLRHTAEPARTAEPLLADADGASVMQQARRRYEAWLPPEPDGRKLLEYLGASRAHVLDRRLPDGQPVVQFEDGGAMPMSLIRWDEDVKNFRPAGFLRGRTGGDGPGNGGPG